MSKSYEEFLKKCKEAGLTEDEMSIIDGKEMISLKGMNKLSQYYNSIGDTEKAAKIDKYVCKVIIYGKDKEEEGWIN